MEVPQDGGGLGPGGGASGQQFAVAAVDEPVAIGPAHGRCGPRADRPFVGELGEVPLGRQVIALILGVVVQHLGELLPADRVVGGELPVSLAGHHAVFVGPANGVPPPVDKGHVVKVGEPAEAGLPL